MGKKIAILGVEVPGTRGGAEAMSFKLAEELTKSGNNVELLTKPFVAEPKENVIRAIAEWRNCDELDAFDVVIGTKFPSYAVKHPYKIIWLVHQHRQAYELYGTRFGDFKTDAHDETIRQLIYAADREAFRESKKVFTISPNVSSRLAQFMGVKSEVLPPPLPLLGEHKKGEAGNYILYAGRICSIKRVDLIVRALPSIHENIKLKIVGLPDEPYIQEFLDSEIKKHHLEHRVEFLGRVSDDALIDLYAHAFLVFFAPYDEDYGFVTLEALSSGKPVLTATDSGGVLEFIQDGVNGFVVEPQESAVAKKINEIWEDKDFYRKLCSQIVSHKGNSWEQVVEKLLEAC